MNLIENLGGYKAVKAKSESDILYGEKIYLKRALLEYRRQNNIFEIGDLVVFKEEYSKDSVIHKIDSLRAGTKCLRHATDEEIEKGCRV
ncbi:hypothetical protein [Acinetobacter phage BUCT629]|uniref:Uncharacterized protein n=4 Tax=root TaxID=1 RepID=A0A1V0DZC3_9CAUD|nr:hypothetical protein FDH41_gp41 [Acinetobacter phage WCHABP12]YP_009604559.1 hypothetical protein FDH91_gp68 [Acinetobacter phage WCHABP1]AYP69057.1 hypothetical protein [Acinetobacter phage vB_AbaM_IME512]QEA11076.1 hypothetical protein Abp9_76 [Acinetobacter phage Abp9]QZI85381.1 hypothetical protein [Acinetobacter phage BUCT629]URY98786.1 hypothetical protein Arbor_72 [Acinetobacter phage Arbor]WHB31274.1 hypothetical protein [Acinetobacter phage P1068]WJZ47781.1 hypothetical protein [